MEILFTGWTAKLLAIPHWAIYAAVYVQLIAGVMTVATIGNGLPFFGMRIPLPMEQDGDAHKFWEEIHEFAWKIIAVLLIVHVLGALYNHFIRKNDVLRRITVGAREG